MNNVWELFLFRLKKEWKYQYGVWKTAVDWVVWLYILIPVLAIVGYQYYLLWQGVAQWVDIFPPFLYWFNFFFLTRMGTIRLFLQEGDLLFLRRKSAWMHRLMTIGLVYSLIRNLVILAASTILLFPILVNYLGASIFEVIIVAGFVFLLQLFVQVSQQLLAIRFRRWKHVGVNFLFLVGTFLLFQSFLFSETIIRAVLGGLLGLAAIWLVKKRLSFTTSFFEDCIRENQERLKLTALFLGASGYKMEKKQRKRPIFLFSNSARLFKNRTSKNLAAELLLKMVIRNKTKLMGTLQITGGGIIAVWIAPSWIKWVLLVVCLFAIVQYIKWGWGDMRTHTFFTLFPKSDHENLLQGVKKGIFLLATPSILFLGLTAGWTAISPLIGLAVAFVSVLFCYFFFIKDAWLS
ncbi:MAG: ABC transporter permease [Bacillus sp. (in: Bacteria)]|nr:ABC transporter permease [Bacillus sp. (in: firmicutes)]